MMEEGETVGEPETIARANERLSHFLDEQIRTLETRRDMLAEVDEIDASLAADRMLVDTSVEGKLLHRYATELLRRVHQSLDHLARLRPSRPAESHPPAEPARDEATPIVRHPHPTFLLDRHDAASVDAFA